MHLRQADVFSRTATTSKFAHTARGVGTAGVNDAEGHELGTRGDTIAGTRIDVDQLAGAGGDDVRRQISTMCRTSFRSRASGA